MAYSRTTVAGTTILLDPGKSQRNTAGVLDGSSPIVTAADFSAFKDRPSMEAYLNTANAAYWTVTRLASQTYNDLQYAVRKQQGLVP
jgi:hypothetical protein